jgi:predicted nucleotidyltransferase
MKTLMLVNNVQNELDKYETELTLMYLTVVGSRNYGYNSEKSDYDLMGVYWSANRSSAVFDNKLTGYVENVTYKATVDNRTVEVTLYDLEKFAKLLFNGSVNVYEALYSNTVLYSTMNVNGFRVNVSENFNVSLLFNLLNFANNCYVDFLSGKTDKTVYDVNKNQFYSAFRLKQALELLDYVKSGVDYKQLNVLYNQLFNASFFETYDYTFNFTPELFEACKSVVQQLNVSTGNSMREGYKYYKYFCYLNNFGA